MRKFLAIILCRILNIVGKAMGKGTSLPGKFALKICPDILRRIEKPSTVIAVTGSNGKTSTVEMIASVLKAAGKTVAYNAAGSNQIEGVTTLLLTSCTLGGKMKQDVLLIESDERYTKHTFRYFHPTHYVITNLYRDQLTRNGHPDWVFDAISESIFDDTTLILNADDPMVSLFGRNRKNVLWFGVEHCAADTREHQGAYHDGLYCPVCGKPMEYDGYHFSHIGFYRCSACDYRRHAPDYAATRLDLEQGSLELNGKLQIPVALKSFAHIYNILATYAICSVLRIPEERISHCLGNYMLKNGRYMEFTLGAHPGVFLVAKHENSVAYDISLDYAVSSGEKCSVLIFVDAVSRKYFTGETSWLWDIRFECLDRENVERIYLCGKYCNDLAVRFSFTGISEDKLRIYPRVSEACQDLAQTGSERVYAVTCFSDKEKFLSNVTLT